MPHYTKKFKGSKAHFHAHNSFLPYSIFESKLQQF